MDNFTSQLKEVKKSNEDFEWYPTTNEILNALAHDIKSTREHSYSNLKSFLDIGAGNGKVIEKMRSIGGFHDFYAIEKSLVLLQSHAADVYTLGVDFHNTPLIDKEVDCIFSNPPYKEYAEWVTRIISEVKSGIVYLVIPDRWENDKRILAAIGSRQAEYKILGNFDFASSEDRAARAKVHLVKFEVSSRKFDAKVNDPFVAFFEENFKYPEPEEKQSEVEQILKTEIIKKENFVETLCMLYARRMKELQENYAAICKMEYAFLKEFEITKDSLIKSLRMKINTAKKLFWEKLFTQMSEITKRLTTSSRRSMLELLNRQTGIEFNRENVYAVVIWAIKNTNSYFDSQFVATYEQMLYAANIENYKSNQRVFKTRGFRYDYVNYKEHSHFCLKVGHRIVLESHYMGLEKGWRGEVKGLTDGAYNFISDLVTIANNLGFHIGEVSIDKYHGSSSAMQFTYLNSENEKWETIFEARCFLNGNMHLRINPDLVHAMNVEHGRLKGWIRSKEEAVEEMNVPQAIAEKVFKADPYLKLNNLNLLKLN